jgi:hypothetical protein
VKSNEGSNTLSDGGDCDDPDPLSLDIVPRSEAPSHRVSDRLGGSLEVMLLAVSQVANNNQHKNKTVLTPASQDHLLATWVHGQWFAGCAAHPRSLHRITHYYSGRAGHVGQVETATPASPMRWDDGELVDCAVCKQRIHLVGHLSDTCKGDWMAHNRRCMAANVTRPNHKISVKETG